MAAIQQHTAVFLLYAVWKNCCIAVFLPALLDTHFLLYAAVCCCMLYAHTAYSSRGHPSASGGSLAVVCRVELFLLKKKEPDRAIRDQEITEHF